MKVAYVDTSCLVGVTFGEPRASDVPDLIRTYELLLSANLLEAEFRSALHRESVPVETPLPTGLTWVLPERPLRAEIVHVLEAGYVRGADLWHLACALYVAESPHEVAFLTLDDGQGAVAEALGFETPL